MEINLFKNYQKQVEALKVGPGMDMNSEMGPLVTKEHLEKVKSYVDIGVKEGSKISCRWKKFEITRL